MRGIWEEYSVGENIVDHSRAAPLPLLICNEHVFDSFTRNGRVGAR
jgi:hypothetical protein